MRFSYAMLFMTLGVSVLLALCHAAADVLHAMMGV